MYIGIIKEYSKVRRCGFIKDIKSSKEYFVKYIDIKDNICVNDKVTFNLEVGKDGIIAVNVRLADL
jgi:cold shock protein